jgi:benzoate membrane transport protein
LKLIKSTSDIIERKALPWKRNIAEFPGYLTVASLSNGVIAWIFGITGPLLIVLQSAAKGNLSIAATSSWIFSIYFIGGVLTVLLSLYYRQPVAFAFSIPGAVLVGTSLARHPFWKRKISNL